MLVLVQTHALQLVGKELATVWASVVIGCVVSLSYDCLV